MKYIILIFFLLYSSQEENGRRSRQDNNSDFMEPDVCDIVEPNDNDDEIINPDEVFDRGLISTDVNKDAWYPGYILHFGITWLTRSQCHI